MHYARAFYSLPRLHTVCITIADLGHGHTTLGDGEGQNQYLWAGECDRCMGIMYEDDTFRDRWMAKKQGIREGGKDIVYVRPPALRKVMWRFWKADDPDRSESEIDSGEE
jgi:hypothetical protein